MANDVSVNVVKFDPASISPEVKAFNKKLQDIAASGPKWYEVGAEKYRQMRARGETPLPPAVLLDSAESSSVSSRDHGRSIPVRILRPQNSTSVKGVFLHIHGGGWVLQDETSQDQYLQDIANSTGLVMVSAGYRRAPEDPFPAGPNDCYDVAEWLVTNSESTFNAPFSYVGGESAGGHLSMLVALHLLQHANPIFSNFVLKGLVLHFGCFDLSFTPSVYTFKRDPVLVLDRDLMTHYIEVFLPGMTLDQKRDPSVSPLYTDLNQLRGRLPPALFTCGTEDPLLDDTVFMSGKWIAAGAETVVKIIPGAPHAYIGFPRHVDGTQSYIGLDAVDDFVRKTL